MMLISAVDDAVPEALSPASAPRTLADVRDVLLALVATDAIEIKLQLSAINTVARACHCAPEDLPANPARLREQLKLTSPAMAGLTKASWASVRSRVQKALQRADVPVMASRRVRPLSDEWTPLYQAIPENGHKASLGRLIGYLSDRNVSPGEVSDHHVGQFGRELETMSLRGRPQPIMRAAIRGWNAAIELVPGWPQQCLTPATAAPVGYVLKPEQFLPEFQASLSDYIAFLRDPPDDDDAPLRGLKPSTLVVREFQLRQMASALVHRGVGAANITSIDLLAHKRSVDEICEFFIARHGRSDAVQLGGLLALLRNIAIHRLRDRDLGAWISRRLRRLFGGRLRRFGMTEKNRRRLSVFRDPQHIRNLLLLPYKLLKQAESGGLPIKDAAKLVRTAVAIELELMCPIRLQNLSEINVDVDLVRSHSGRKATVHLFIPGTRTKNGEEIELEIPVQLMSLVDLYLTKYRSHLIQPQHRGNGPRFLFPRPDGAATVGRVLAAAICKVLLRELGMTFNVHLFRHLGCYLYLKSHPGQLDVMRRVLGHRDGETTRRFYAFVEQSDAFRLFDANVLRVRDEALRPRRGSKPHSKRTL